ncbi:MAG: nicotinate (nicotinamide) nucleotide adenylyltransferase [Desulfobulbus sp.]|nr:nicotinate (nicotinamide) nucleotide adenylyltransferase [Desulfobulbus sp.]
MAVSTSPQSIGLFGGTFDPVHAGHLALAGHVLERCRLDRLLFIPAPEPPHKRRPEASFAHRTAMLEAALADCPHRARMALSLIEADLPTPSYTIRTVEALMAHHGRNRYFLVIGADSLRDLPHWHRGTELLARVSLIVVRRDGTGPGEPGRILTELASGFVPGTEPHSWRGPTGTTLTYLDDVHFPVSSSSIREQLRRGETPVMLPPAVFAYIRSHCLYGWQRPA